MFNDSSWHNAMFSHQGNRTVLYVDGFMMGHTELCGETKYIKLESEFYIGGIPEVMQENDMVQKNLGCISTKFNHSGESNVKHAAGASFLTNPLRSVAW